MSNRPMKYVIDGETLSKEDFYRHIAEQEIRLFAYESQLSLFPDEEVEAVRTQLREKFDSGNSLDATVIHQIFF
ncbi:MAG: hypothetical protein Q8P81_04700 [Nanoarchaeota archaeon]|nr:hypothetical protein [Nanoarchaeota archaeon]